MVSALIKQCVEQMASQEPLLQTDTEHTPRPKVLSLAFFRQWTKGQPLRETESLDYEPLYNKVYFARRKQPSRRFYGYAGFLSFSHILPVAACMLSLQAIPRWLILISVLWYSYYGTHLSTVGAGIRATPWQSSLSLWQQGL